MRLFELCHVVVCCVGGTSLQNINAENMEEYVGYELPAKFLEVDEVGFVSKRGSLALLAVTQVAHMAAFFPSCDSSGPHGGFLTVVGCNGWCAWDDQSINGVL